MAPTRSCVHYKFSSKLNYDTVTFEGLHISLCHLKRQIMGREKLKAANCDLQISNAQTNEEYTDDNTLIPKNTSVIVRRIPVGGVKATSKTSVMTPKSHKILETAFRSQTEPVSGTPKAIGDSSASVSLVQLAETANLTDASASEEDKIKAMMIQASRDYDPIKYMKKPLGPFAPSHTCFRCGKPGHYIRNCPLNGESVPRIKKSTGIPMSFMMEVKDPNTKGAMLTNTGKYAIPTINAEAYAQGKKEKPRLLPEEPSSSSSSCSDDPVPDQFLCLICKDIMMDAVLIPCCGNSCCDECIRTALLESEEHTCPVCHQTDVSPDALVANKFLRQAVNNFRNGTDYRKQIQQQQLPPPPPAPPLMRQPITRNLQPLLWPTISRQQKALMIPLGPLASHSAAALSSLAPALSPVPAGLPVDLSSGVVSDLPPVVSQSLPAEKPGGPFCDADTVRPPAALVTSAELSKSSSLSISSLLEEKGCQIPVLRQPALPSLLGPQRQSLPTTGHPMRASTIRSAGGRPGRELCSNRGRPSSDRTQRTQAPTLPAPPPVLVPVPPPALYPPARPLPPGVAPPHFPPQFPPGQPLSAGYTVPPPGYPPAPATMSSPWVSAAVPTACSNTLPRTQAPPLSREEFYREHQRLKEEEKKKSKLDEFTDDFAKEVMEYKKIRKERRRSFSRSKSPYSTSSYSRSLYTYSKSRSGSFHSRSYSRSFSRSHSRSSSRSPTYSRRGKGKSCKYRSRSRSHGYHRPRSAAYRRYHSRSRSPVPRGQSSTKRTLPEGEGERQYFGRYREVPLYDMKAYYGRSVDLRDLIKTPANASQEKVDTDSEDSSQMEPPVKKAKQDLPKTDNVKTSSSQKERKALGTPQKADPKVTEDHPETRPAKEEKAKKDHPKETKSERPSNKEDKSKKPAEKSKPSDAKPGKRKVNDKVDKDHEAPSIKVAKRETAELKTLPKGKTEPDGEKGEQTPEKDKSASLDNPANKTELNRETGKKFVSGQKVPPAKEPVEEPEPSSSQVKQEKARGKVRRKVTAADGSSSTLVDYSSTSTPGGSTIRKTEEEPDTRQTVIKTMEEYNNDIPAPAEDVIIMMQVPQSKWDKDDFESEEEDIKSARVPANIEKPASVIKNVSAKPPKPLEETQKTTKEVSYEGCQHDAKSSRSLMSNEKGKTKDKDPSEQRKRKHDPGHGSTAKDFPPDRDKKSDHDGNRDRPNSKCRDEKSELAKGKDSPSQNRESTSLQKSKRRDERADPSKKGTGDAKRSSYSPLRERKQTDDKAAHDSKHPLEEHGPLDKNSEDEKHVPPEVKSNKEKEPGGNKPPSRQEWPDVKNEKENVTGQNDGSVVKPNPPVSSSSWLSSALTRETDEAAFVPDCGESDSESNGGGFGSKPQASNQDSNISAKDEEAAGKHPKDLTEKAVAKVKEDTAAPAAVEQPEASGSQSQSSASVGRSRRQSLSESQTRSHSSSAGPGESQGSKKKQKKKEKKQHEKHKRHKKHKKRTGNETELGKSQKHKHKKKKQKKSKDREKDDEKVKSVIPRNDR